MSLFSGVNTFWTFLSNNSVIKDLQIWLHLLKKSLMENFICCTVAVQRLNSLFHFIFQVLSAYPTKIATNQQRYTSTMSCSSHT